MVPASAWLGCEIVTTTNTSRTAAVDPLVLTRRAEAGQRVGALALDLLIPLAWVGIAIVLFATGHPAFAAISLLIAIVFIAASIRMLARAGLTLGLLATRTRTVRRSTGAPAGTALARAFVSGDLATFDLRRGRDPIAPALGAFEFPAVAPATASRRRSVGMTPIAELDSGERLALAAALVIGRNPSAPLDAPAEVYQWPDLSRTLSKSHTRLEWDGQRLWAIDLGSTNGTLLRADAAAQRLVPFQRTPIEVGNVLELGDRVVTIRTMS